MLVFIVLLCYLFLIIILKLLAVDSFFFTNLATICAVEFFCGVQRRFFHWAALYVTY